MKVIKDVSEAINSTLLKSGTVIYTGGNAATPQTLLKQLIKDSSIKDVELISVLLLGELKELFNKQTCLRIKHRIIFSGPHSRNALNKGLATYQVMHLSNIPHQVKNYLKPNVVFINISGPDKGGNYSLGTTVEGLQAAIQYAKANGGIIIAEKNKQMPFILGTTINESHIDFLIETDYPLPVIPYHRPDKTANKIGRLITELYISNGSTLQYGIGKVPEAVTDALIEKGVKDIGIYTELFTDSMQKLIEKGIVTNRYSDVNFSISSIFLAKDKSGYDWLDYNSSVQSRPCNFTNSILRIAQQHKMIAINSAIGVDLHGNIWADSLKGRQIYSGIGGQADFLRGSILSKEGFGIIAMESTTNKGISKIIDMCPEGITTTAIAADPVIIVTENGAFNPMGLNLVEHAIGIAHLAEPKMKETLLRKIYDSPEFYKSRAALSDRTPKGFTPYSEIK
ncbi:MAG: acetyl-CoA hydrolase/transferase family protein [Bacteroidetes bacterium]|nr:acetyl-CoA hydrolase/transferase family protein [Bacteroidota bacterium]